MIVTIAIDITKAGIFPKILFSFQNIKFLFVRCLSDCRRKQLGEVESEIGLMKTLSHRHITRYLGVEQDGCIVCWEHVSRSNRCCYFSFQNAVINTLAKQHYFDPFHILTSQLRIFLEYVSGGSIKSLIDDAGALPEELTAVGPTSMAFLGCLEL